VHVRIDEGGREHGAGLAARLEAGDHPVLDREAQGLVDALRRIEHTAFEDERVSPARPEEHHATSNGSAAATATGPVVSKS
jgi:hypothetical protein